MKYDVENFNCRVIFLVMEMEMDMLKIAMIVDGQDNLPEIQSAMVN